MNVARSRCLDCRGVAFTLRSLRRGHAECVRRLALSSLRRGCSVDGYPPVAVAAHFEEDVNVAEDSDLSIQSKGANLMRAQSELPRPACLPSLEGKLSKCSSESGRLTVVYPLNFLKASATGMPCTTASITLSSAATSFGIKSSV